MNRNNSQINVISIDDIKIIDSLANTCDQAMQDFKSIQSIIDEDSSENTQNQRNNAKQLLLQHSNSLQSIKQQNIQVKQAYLQKQEQINQQFEKIKLIEQQLIEKVKQYLEIKQLMNQNTTVQSVANQMNNFKQFINLLFSPINQSLTEKINSKIDCNTLQEQNDIRSLVQVIKQYFIVSDHQFANEQVDQQNQNTERAQLEHEQLFHVQTENNQLKQQIIQLQTQATDLHSYIHQNSTITQQFEQFQQFNKHVDEKIQNQIEKLNQKSLTILQLQQQLDIIQENRSKSQLLQNQSEQNETQIKQLKELNQQLNLKLQNYQEDNNQQQQRTKDLILQINESEQINDQLNKTILQLKQQILSQQQDQNDQIHKNINQQTNELVIKYEGKLNNAEQLIMRLQNQVEVKQKELDLYERTVLENILQKSGNNISEVKILSQNKIIQDLISEKSGLQLEMSQLNKVYQQLLLQYNQMKVDRENGIDLLKEDITELQQNMQREESQHLNINSQLQHHKQISFKYQSLLKLLLGDDIMDDEYIKIVGLIDKVTTQLQEHFQDDNINVFQAVIKLRQQVSMKQVEVQSLSQQLQAFENSQQQINGDQQWQVSESEPTASIQPEQQINYLLEIQKLFGVTDQQLLLQEITKKINDDIEEQQSNQAQIKALKDQLQLFENHVLQLNEQLLNIDEKLLYDFTIQEFNSFYDFVIKTFEQLDEVTQNTSQTFQLFKSQQKNLISFFTRDNILVEMLNQLKGNNKQQQIQTIKFDTKDQTEKLLLKAKQKIIKLEEQLLIEIFEKEKLKYWQQYRINPTVVYYDILQEVRKLQADESDYQKIIQQMVQNGAPEAKQGILKENKKKK